MTIAPRFEGDDRRRCWPTSPKRDSSTRGCARRCGACTTRRRWPKPRSSTTITSRRRSTCASRRTTRSAPTSCGASALTDDGTPLSIAIWTTTPWTLPANVAIAIKPDAEYAIYRVGGEDVVVAEALAAPLIERDLRRARRRRLARAWHSAMRWSGASVRHPFIDRDSVVVRADYVELETGTGAVHTAPGHGVDDFDTGVKYGLPILNPVDGAGRFTAEAGPYAGQNIFEAQQQIIDDLRAAGLLFAAESYVHSYPHCWRCKNPVVFRATAQWFIAMDANGLRQRDRRRIARGNVDAGVGRRTHDADDRKSSGVVRLAAAHVGYADPGADLRGLSTSRSSIRASRASSPTVSAPTARACGGPIRRKRSCRRASRVRSATATTFTKEMNIVDIWFESGVTHRAVLEDRGLPWPADVYLEGGDQYRGWFRSSLVTAVATKGAAAVQAGRRRPAGSSIRTVARCTSRPATTSVRVDGMEKYGADVLRLWVASVEYTADVRLGAKLLENVANVYRNLRNRFRWYLGSVDDLTPDAVVAARRDGTARPARAREARRGRARHRRRLPRIPPARRVPRAAAFRRRRSLGVLRRRAQGPALHERARRRRAGAARNPRCSRSSARSRC